MAADTMPVLSGVVHDQRRSLLLRAVAVAAVTAVYVGFYPAMGEAADLQPFIENMPEGLVQALGYDRIASSAGYLRSTIYGLLGPVLLLVLAFGTITMAVGAVTGRRVHALAVAAALAVVAFVLDAIGPLVGADWMTAVSPFSWYIEPNPLAEGFHAGHIAMLAALAIAAAAIALPAFDRRDVMV
jgi:hypothetical protein